MRLKGRAKITIKNADGSIAHQEEHENTITPALEKIFNHNLAGTVDFTKITPIMSELLGGVACWNGSFSSESIYLPKQEDAKLIAIAGQGNNSSSGARGSKVSGSVVKNGNDVIGYRWTWNWLQNQGIGRISDVTLIHKDVGDGYNQAHGSSGLSLEPLKDVSNYIIDANDFTYSSSSPLPSALPSPVGISNQKKIPIGFYDDINRVVSIELVEDSVVNDPRGGDWRQGHVNVYISKFTGTGLWIWNEIGDMQEEQVIEIKNNLVWQQANRNQLGRGIFYIAYDESIKHIYVIWGGYFEEASQTYPCNVDWYPYSKEIYYIDCDLTTGTQVKKTVGFASDLAYMFRMHTNTYEPIQLQVVDGCIFMPMYYVEPLRDFVLDDEAYVGARINMRTATIEDYIEGYMAEIGSNALSYNSHCGLGNGRAMFPNSMVEKREARETIQLDYLESISPTTGLPVYGQRDVYSRYYSDPVTRTESLFASVWHQNRAYSAMKADSLIQFHTLIGDNVGGDKIRGASLNKMYIASKFHLEDSVNKNSTQTMTVEYELIQQEEEET